ncbi:hypothetical protein AF72_00445 [Xylella taiwanensis]|uniref:Uncharacterized protein n=1 Tax=Xylella taiwanensis TaxID=1444770 RepID=Z9JNV4_9GAMM|nr:hypothetical protein AF72_00445 [Xylella taiwanensis]
MSWPFYVRFAHESGDVPMWGACSIGPGCGTCVSIRSGMFDDRMWSDVWVPWPRSAACVGVACCNVETDHA